MAKINKTASNKLEMVPATGDSMKGVAARLATQFTPAALPKGFVKVSRPPLVKPDQIPVNGQIQAEIVGLSDSISKKESMQNSKLIHLRLSDGEFKGTEFLFPLTGVIKQAVGGNDGISKNVGKQLLIIRREDDVKEQDNGEIKKMFMFDVYMSA